jgi:hypothetical protein
MCFACPLAAGLSVRRNPKFLSRVDYDSTMGGIQNATRALDFTAPMADGGWRGLARAKKGGRSVKVGVRAVEKEEEDNCTTFLAFRLYYLLTLPRYDFLPVLFYPALPQNLPT